MNNEEKLFQLIKTIEANDNELRTGNFTIIHTEEYTKILAFKNELKQNDKYDFLKHQKLHSNYLVFLQKNKNFINDSYFSFF